MYCLISYSKPDCSDGGATLFLAGADHGYCEKEKRTRQNNLQSATVSLQVVIGLCRCKETAALKIKAAVSNGRVKLSALRRLFFFCRRAADHFNIRLKYRYSVLSSTNTTSGRLLNRNGIILFPRPRLTTIFVFPSV